MNFSKAYRYIKIIFNGWKALTNVKKPSKLVSSNVEFFILVKLTSNNYAVFKKI